jgi:hypothetical protein
MRVNTFLSLGIFSLAALVLSGCSALAPGQLVAVNCDRPALRDTCSGENGGYTTRAGGYSLQDSNANKKSQ